LKAYIVDVSVVWWASQ